MLKKKNENLMLNFKTYEQYIKHINTFKFENIDLISDSVHVQCGLNMFQILTMLTKNKYNTSNQEN